MRNLGGGGGGIAYNASIVSCIIGYTLNFIFNKNYAGINIIMYQCRNYRLAYWAGLSNTVYGEHLVAYNCA